MIISKNTPGIQHYKIHAESGEQIHGLASFDTVTYEAEAMVIPDARVVTAVNADGSKEHHVRGSRVEIKKIKIDGAYATFRGQRVRN